MRQIKPPTWQQTPVRNTLFLAGGITGCPDWQKEMINLLKDVQPLTIFNPRRDDFDVTNPNMSKEQIEWEFCHLRKSAAISFWFPGETLCPITLLELGKYLENFSTKLFIGCDPGYAREFDVREQTRLSRGRDVTVVSSIEELASQIRTGFTWWCDLGRLE
jgi:hypothetical protein